MWKSPRQDSPAGLIEFRQQLFSFVAKTNREQAFYQTEHGKLINAQLNQYFKEVRLYRATDKPDIDPKTNVSYYTNTPAARQHLADLRIYAERMYQQTGSIEATLKACEDRIAKLTNGKVVSILYDKPQDVILQKNLPELKAGDIRGAWKFKGGDPSKEENWELIK